MATVLRIVECTRQTSSDTVPAMSKWVPVVFLCGLAIACSRPGAPKTPRPASATAIDYATAGAIEPVPGDADDRPFYPGDYDPTIATPASLLGHPIGSEPAPGADVVACFRRWAEESPRVDIATYATSYEGRELVRVVISSEKNLKRIEQIKRNIGRLADPRGLASAEADAIIADTPAIAWMGYSIHGGETSGSDAAVALGYHLIASTEPAVAELLERVVVVVDPVLNPDGRARALGTIREMRSLRPSENYASRHRWRWPGGRGNHYLFDLNRDWIIGAHPETRGRWQVIRDFNPQLMVDAHEMGATDTYLFSPENRPYNPNMPERHAKWLHAFGQDLARAFDARGWAYYTREWSETWYPGYTTTWGQLIGAIGILYEQSQTSGLPLRRPSGKRVTYRESVRGHAVSSWVTLQTLGANREAVLRDYLADMREASDSLRHRRAFAVAVGRNPDRERALLEILLRSGVEVYRSAGELSARKSVSSLGERRPRVKLPAGTLVIPEAQPRGALVRAMLEFDPRFSADELRAERFEIERRHRSRIYDVTAWNLGQTFDVDCYWIDAPGSGLAPVTALPSAGAGSAAEEATPAYAWGVDGRDDGSVAFAARALELGLEVQVADKPFERDGAQLSRGSVVVLRAENPDDVAELVASAAGFAGVRAIPLSTGRARDDGPDLGGHHFHRLVLPRIGILADAPMSASGFGHLWYHLDQRLKIPITILDLQSLGMHDLRRYNVNIAGNSWGGIAGNAAVYAERLKAWLQQGGTLIALGDSAASLASAKLGLSAVRLRRDSLEALALYQAAATRSVAAREIEIDEKAIWDGKPVKPEGERKGDKSGAATGAVAGGGVAAAEKAKPAGETAGEEPEEPKPPTPAEYQDEWERRFAPRGTILLGLVDDQHWLTAGVGADRMPVMFTGDAAYLATDPVRVPVRLAAAEKLRLSGLLWPEARARLADTAYVTVERVGAGQVILFASDPVFRASTRGTARLLSNAVVYGPALGASQPTRW